MNNEILIQRLVDGDLPSSQRSELIAGLKSDGHWKQIAIAFVEKQILDETIGDVAGAIAGEESRVDPSFRLTGYTARKIRISHFVAAAAASVLLLAFGYWMGTNEREQLVADRNDDLVELDRSAPLELTDALSRCIAPIPERFRLDLLQAGYLLNEDEKLADVSLPFGGTIQMPVRSFDIRYLGASAFQ